MTPFALKVVNKANAYHLMFVTAILDGLPQIVQFSAIVTDTVTAPMQHMLISV